MLQDTVEHHFLMQIFVLVAKSELHSFYLSLLPFPFYQLFKHEFKLKILWIFKLKSTRLLSGLWIEPRYKFNEIENSGIQKQTQLLTLQCANLFAWTDLNINISVDISHFTPFNLHIWLACSNLKHAIRWPFLLIGRSQFRLQFKPIIMIVIWEMIII